MGIVSIIFPLLFMVSLGYGLTRAKVFNREQIGGISKFAFYISIPAFLFLNMLKADLSRSLDISAMMTFYIPVIVVFTLGVLLNDTLVGYWGRAKKRGEKGPDEHIVPENAPAYRAVYGLGCSYSNTVLVGLPIIIAALGEQMMGMVFVIITFHSALLFALTFILASLGTSKATNRHFDWQSFLRSIVLNPVVLSITLGIIANGINLKLGDELSAGLRLLSEPALASALFVLGANLSFYRIREGWQLAAVASGVKLILLPAFVYLLGHFLFSIEPQPLAVIVLLSASPLGVNSYLVATQLKAHQATLGSTVVLSTLLCVPSFGFWLWWLI